MNTVTAVLGELYSFVFFEWFGFRVNTPAESVALLSYSVPTLLEAPHSSREQSITNSISPKDEVEQTRVYVATTNARLYGSPVAAFDSTICTVPFGAVVYLQQTQNRWAFVRYNGLSGWLLREDLSEYSLHPQLISGEIYDAERPETKAIRAFIGDEFGGETLGLPLQDVEYVTYRLLQRGKFLPWGEERPRTPGAWQRLLKGKEKVFISVNPAVDAVAEMIYEDDTGHVAYIDAVFPDHSILLSEIGASEPGEFKATTLTKEEWREHHPIFITVS